MRFGIVASVFGFLGVALGAFGAHALKRTASVADLAIWETAVKYQLIHAVVLLWIASLTRQLQVSGTEAGLAPLQWAGWSFTAGVVIFSGSLYVLVLSGVRKLGMVTPIGGLAMLAGWVALGIAWSRSAVQ